MRFVLLLLIAATAGCGGSGHCANPPCDIPERTCKSNADCFASQFCNFARDSCGSSNVDEGRCAERPAACDAVLDRVCGCDGKFHSNECEAASNGTDVAMQGNCPAPSGTFKCGPRVCDIVDQVCVELVFGPDASDFMCDDFPQSCSSERTCQCVAGAFCGECVQATGFTVKCRPVADPS